MSPKSQSASPPPDQRRAPTRQTRADFDKEPNPFEQSFSATPRSASSNLRNSSPNRDSSDDSNIKDRPLSRNSQNRSASPSRPVLPPIASLQSPADPSYAWSYPNSSIANSLRAGPLSPAMLAGPQSTNEQPHLQFDPSSFRTGLTPRSGFTPRTGLTPAGTGLTPLVGGPVNFPPSPGTAAILAMMNPNNSNSSASGATITPNTLNALTGVISNGLSNGNSNDNNSNGNAYPSHAQMAHSQQNGDHSNGYLNASNAASTAANGLFLLSQAHQELTKREEAQARAGNVNGTHGSNGINGVALNGKRKRKSLDDTSPPSPTVQTSNRGPAKRSRAAPAPNGRGNKRSPRLSEELGGDDDDDDDEDENDMDDGDGGSGNGSATGRRSKRPETEEEKRRNFLERNRQAALKCRQRKKAWLSQLQAKVEFLTNENERLTSALVSSREEISRLSALVGGAGVVGSMAMGVGPVAGPGVQPVSMNVSMSGKAQTAVAAGGPSNGGRGSGYGY